MAQSMGKRMETKVNKRLYPIALLTTGLIYGNIATAQDGIDLMSP